MSKESKDQFLQIMPPLIKTLASITSNLLRNGIYESSEKKKNTSDISYLYYSKMYIYKMCIYKAAFTLLDQKKVMK